MNYIFGPVPSRRLGLSLGIDPTVVSGPFTDDRHADSKVCNWNCAYCQLGRTHCFTTARARYYPPEAMFEELQETLATDSARNIDWITFVGSGEPTLSSDLGTMIRGVKSMTDIPVAVLTNGSLLSDIRVREDLMSADAVLPTLDAGTEELYRRINRPHPNYNFERIIRGMIAFRARYSGKLWIECMLIAGVNDDEASLHDIAAAMKRVAPDEIHLVLPDRPPAEPWVKPADEDGILRARTILGGVARTVYPAEVEFERGAIQDPLEAAAAIIARHPMSNEELARSLSLWGVSDTETAIRMFAESGRGISVERHGKTFWRAP